MADTTQLIYEIIIKDNGSNTSKKVRDEFSKLGQSAQTLKDIFSKLNPSFSLLSTAMGGLSAGFSVLKGAFNGIMSIIKGFGNLLASIGKGVVDFGKKLVETIVESLIDAGKSWAKYEQTMVHAAQTMDLGEEATLKLGEQIRELALNATLHGGVAANELARIAGVLGQLGFSAEEAIGGAIETVAMLSTAFGMSANKTAESMAIILNAFHRSRDEMGNVGSAIALVGASTAATASQILDFTTRLAPMASAFGLTTEQVIGLAGAMREVGVQTRVGATATSQLLQRIMVDYERYAEVLGLSSASLKSALLSNDPSQALFMVLEALDKINTYGDKLQLAKALQDLGIVGARAQQAILALTQNVDGVRKQMELAKKGSEENVAAQEMYNKAVNTTSGKWNQFKNILQEIWYTIGQPLAQAFANFIENYLIPFAKEFQEFFAQSGMAEALFKIFDTGFTLVGELMKPIIEILMHWLDINSKDLPAAVEKLSANMRKWLTEHRDQIETWILQKWIQVMNAWDDLRDWWAANWPKIESALKALVEVITWLEQEIYSLKQVWEDWGIITDNFWEEMVGWIQEVTGLTEGWLQGLLEIVNVFGKIAAFNFGKIIEGWSALIRKAGEMVGALEKVDEVQQGNSVFPDMFAWLGKNKGAWDTLTQTTTNYGKKLSEVSMFTSPEGLINAARTTPLPSMFTSPEGLVNAQKLRTILTTQASGSAAQASLDQGVSQVSQAAREATIINNINLNGTNIIDEYSMDRLTDEITKRQKTTSSSRLYGGS